jgi:hypothetical protein
VFLISPEGLDGASVVCGMPDSALKCSPRTLGRSVLVLAFVGGNESCDVLCVDAAVGRQKTSSPAVRGTAAAVGSGRIVTVGLNGWP